MHLSVTLSLPHYFFMEALVCLKRLVSATGDALTLAELHFITQGCLVVLFSHLSGSDVNMKLHLSFYVHTPGSQSPVQSDTRRKASYNKAASVVVLTPRLAP